MRGLETKKDLPQKQCEELLRTLKVRFEKNMNRHKGLDGLKYKQSWANTQKLWSLSEMERGIYQKINEY